MKLLSRLFADVRSLLRRSRTTRELDDELRAFLEESVEAKLAAGMSRAAAERAAHLEVGSAAAVKDWTRDVGWEGRIESLWQDVRYAVRLMHRSPVFSLGAFISLALGTGAVLAIYLILYTALIRPLPVADEGSLAVLYAVDRTGGPGPVSYPRLGAWRDSEVFVDLAGVIPTTFDISIDGFADRVAAQGVTANFFRTLGVSGPVGRLLDETDVQADASSTPAVISHPMWTQRFASDRAILGRSLTTQTGTFIIVGVAPPGLERWRGEAHIWVPMESITDPRVRQSDGYRLFTPIARLRLASDRRVASEQLGTINLTFDEAAGTVRPDGPSETVRISSLRDDVVPRTIKWGIYALLFGAGLTWAVVCANVANLLLGRGAQRASELSVRRALGAHPGRLFRQLLVESLVLALPGAAAGLLIAYWAVRLFTASVPLRPAGEFEVGMDLPVLFVAGMLSMVTMVGCGAIPAVRLSRLPRRSEDVRWSSPTRFSPMLLAAQFATAVVILIGALLAVKSARHMQSVDVGFRPDSVLTVRYQSLGGPVQNADQTTRKAIALQHAIVERLEGLPGVESVTLADMLFRPAHTIRWSIAVDDGRRFLNGDPEGRPFAPRPHVVGPGYFRIHGVAMLHGREFTQADHDASTPVVIVNRTMAEMLWPGERAIGRRVNFGAWHPRRGFDEPWSEVVGVAGDMRYGGVDEPVLPEVYRPADQAPLRMGGYVLLKTLVPPHNLSDSIRERLREIDPAVAVHPPVPLDALVAESTALTRHSATVLFVCASIAMLLSAFGVYSLLSYAVASRRRELGIRLALGASPSRLVRDVLRPGIASLVPGIILGLVVGALAAPSLENVLFGVKPRDPSVFVLAGCAVPVIGIAAAWIAARRAARVDPLIALKAE